MENERTSPLEQLPAELRQMILAEVTTDIEVDSRTSYDLATIPTEHTAKWEWLRKTKGSLSSGKNRAEYAKFQALYAVSSTLRADMEIVEKQWLRRCPMNLAAFERWLEDPNRGRRDILVLAINPQDFLENPPNAYREIVGTQKEDVRLRAAVQGHASPGWTPYYQRWADAIRRLPNKAFSKIILCETEEPVTWLNNLTVPLRYGVMPRGPQQMLEGLLLIRTRSWKKEAVVTEYRKIPCPCCGQPDPVSARFVNGHKLLHRQHHCWCLKVESYGWSSKR